MPGALLLVGVGLLAWFMHSLPRWRAVADRRVYAGRIYRFSDAYLGGGKDTIGAALAKGG